MRVLKENLNAVARLETVDGFIISYLPKDHISKSKYPCPAELCTPLNLDMIMTHIENIERKKLPCRETLAFNWHLMVGLLQPVIKMKHKVSN
jgi:hypothetical protein